MKKLTTILSLMLLMMGMTVKSRMPVSGRASSVLWNWSSTRERRSSLPLFSFLPLASILAQIRPCLMFW